MSDSVKSVVEEANAFYDDMAKLVNAFVDRAEKFTAPLLKEQPQLAQRANGALFMLNEKTKEAMHRVGDLCAISAQSSKAAGEVVGAPQ